MKGLRNIMIVDGLYQLVSTTSQPPRHHVALMWLAISALVAADPRRLRVSFVVDNADGLMVNCRGPGTPCRVDDENCCTTFAGPHYNIRDT